MYVLLLAHAQKVAVSNNHENSLSSLIIIIVIPSSILSLELLHPPPPTLHMDKNEAKRKGFFAPTAQEFLLVGKNIQNKVGRPIGSIGTEDPHFREFWGRAHLSLQTCGL